MKKLNFSIKDCNIIVDEHCLEFSDSTKEQLQPKFIEVLECLAINHPRLLSRDELITEVWDGNFLVGEQSLTNAIWNLRQLFRKHFADTVVIETVRKSGYRLAIEPVFEEKQENIKDSSVKFVSQPVVVMSIAFLSLFALLSYFFSNSATEFQKVNILAITKEPGRELFPAISFDDNLVAFKWIRPGHSVDLYLKHLNQPDLAIKRLTYSEEEEGAPVWSKDASHLYYNRINRAEKSCHVMKLTIKNGLEEAIAECQFQRFTQIAITSDGKKLAYLSPAEKDTPAPIVILNLEQPTQPPFIINCKENCNYRNRDLAFSPDDKSLAVTRREGGYNENIYLINLVNFKTTQITEGFYNIVGLTWHPDNHRIIFGAQDSAVRQGYVVNVITRQTKVLGVEGFSFPKFSNDGEFLLYHYRIAKRYIASLSLDENTKTSLFPLLLSEFNHRNQSYSEINKKIVYTSNETGHFELWLSDTSGLQREQLTFLEKELESPSWSHDGKKITFLAPSDSQSGNRIYVLDILTKKISSIDSPFKSHGRPGWVSDDSSILASVTSEDGHVLFEFPLNGDPAFAKSRQNAIYGQMDSKGVLFFTNDEKNLWMQPADPNEPATQVLKSEKFSSLYLWKLTQKGIIYYQPKAGEHLINFYDFSSNKTSLIAELPWLIDDKYGSFSFVEDEKKLLITIEDYPQANIKQLVHPLLN